MAPVYIARCLSGHRTATLRFPVRAPCEIYFYSHISPISTVRRVILDKISQSVRRPHGGSRKSYGCRWNLGTVRWHLEFRYWSRFERRPYDIDAVRYQYGYWPIIVRSPYGIRTVSLRFLRILFLVTYRTVPVRRPCGSRTGTLRVQKSSHDDRTVTGWLPRGNWKQVYFRMILVSVSFTYKMSLSQVLIIEDQRLYGIRMRQRRNVLLAAADCEAAQEGTDVPFAAKPWIQRRVLLWHYDTLMVELMRESHGYF